MISFEEIQVMLNRYPEEKPVAFNFVQAKEDLERLAGEYMKLVSQMQTATMIEGNQVEKQFIVLIDSQYVRDAQILPGDFFYNDDFELDDDAQWHDIMAAMCIEILTCESKKEAILKVARDKDINAEKLFAFQI